MWRRSIGGATVVIEDHAPIVVTTWYGTAGRELIDAVFDEMEALHERASQPILVMISNVVTLGAMPPASERKHMAERTEELTSHIDYEQASIVVMKSPLARAGLTAVQWFSRTASRSRTCATIDQAFRRAQSTLASMGGAWPASLDPASYEVPAPAQKSAG
jgi:hypothetical protein